MALTLVSCHLPAKRLRKSTRSTVFRPLPIQSHLVSGLWQLLRGAPHLCEKGSGAPSSPTPSPTRALHKRQATHIVLPSSAQSAPPIQSHQQLFQPSKPTKHRQDAVLRPHRLRRHFGRRCRHLLRQGLRRPQDRRPPERFLHHPARRCRMLRCRPGLPGLPPHQPVRQLALLLPDPECRVHCSAHRHQEGRHELRRQRHHRGPRLLPRRRQRRHAVRPDRRRLRHLLRALRHLLSGSPPRAHASPR
ncbi:hypothetical protein B0J12DRAFT_157973 [Macrophomina phaseolina]|uniref:Uncharacterized protein n=1 Tax=Macrophomina phaseolina TaxID=35725 RepID=A0ABQ8GRX9_9PEZI|nr:hypothetical protein B0J12DRAFT_157973 [Macrophomina phaseolina]